VRTWNPPVMGNRRLDEESSAGKRVYLATVIPRSHCIFLPV
jgi:hypothetical protein